jgi:MoxR-like ATPase
VVEGDKELPQQHPRANINGVPNADEIFKEVSVMAEKWDNTTELPLSERTIIKDRLRYLNGRCEWIANELQREYVQKPINILWGKILHSA